MAIPRIDPLTNLPSITDPANFDARADNFIVTQLPQLVSQINIASAAMEQAVVDADNASNVAVNGSSASSVVLGGGSKTFAVLAGHSWSVGTWLIAASRASPGTHWIIGQVTSYVTTSLVIAVHSFGGSGSRADWDISLTARPPDLPLATPTTNGLMPAADKAKVDNLDSALAGKAPLVSPAITGNPTAPTQPQTDNSTRLANTQFVKAAIAALAGSAPAALDTLVELAAAMGNDPNFSTTVINSLAAKLPNNGGSFSGGYSGAAGSALSGASITPALAGGHMQSYTAPAGAWTINAPVGSGYYDLEVLVTNPAGGSGVMTPSGFTNADKNGYKQDGNARCRLFIAVRGSQKFLNSVKAS